MKAKGQYNTNQRKELQSYLETIAGEHTTVAEICGHFSALGKSIGTSTVYRQLERMVDKQKRSLAMLILPSLLGVQ